MARQADGVLDCVPSATHQDGEGKRSPQSPPALPAKFCWWLSQVPALPLRRQLCGSKGHQAVATDHRAKSLLRDKIKPFAIAQVELSSFYWFCYSISSRGMQLWMEPRWLSPVENAPMFLGVLQFNLFSFVIFCDDEIQITWLGIINGPNSFSRVLSWLLYRPHSPQK